jgi:hypothetical protein
MTEPQNDQEMAASLALTVETSERLADLLKGLPPMVQLDALLRTYVTLGAEHGQLEKVGSALLELGGSILFRQMLQQPRPARTTVSAPGQADYPPAPTTRQ